MISYEKMNGGFVGLIMLFIGVAIIVLLIVRTDLFGGSKGGESAIEGGFDAIDKANEAKNLIEQRSRDAAGQN